MLLPYFRILKLRLHEGLMRIVNALDHQFMLSQVPLIVSWEAIFRNRAVAPMELSANLAVTSGKVHGFG